MIAFLDTDIIIDFLKGREDAAKKIKLLRDSRTEICASVINYQEAMKGFVKEKYKEDEGNAELFFSSITIINYTPAEAKIALMIESILEPKGQAIGRFDVMIAATCMNVKGTLVTRNLKHFRRVPGLKVEAW